MPLYEYECRSCNTRFEQLVFNRQTDIVCSKCGSADIAQLLSTFAVGAESGRSAAPAGACEGCQGMQGGTCPMNR